MIRLYHDIADLQKTEYLIFSGFENGQDLRCLVSNLIISGEIELINCALKDCFTDLNRLENYVILEGLVFILCLDL